MSDTPRMKAAQQIAMEHMTGDVWRVGCDLERELNEGNDSSQVLREQNEWLNERHVMFVRELTHSDEKYKKTLVDLVNAMSRIQQLEEAGDALSKTQTYDLLENTNWRKAKEAKL